MPQQSERGKGLSVTRLSGYIMTFVPQSLHLVWRGYGHVWLPSPACLWSVGGWHTGGSSLSIILLDPVELIVIAMGLCRGIGLVSIPPQIIQCNTRHAGHRTTAPSSLAWASVDAMVEGLVMRLMVGHCLSSFLTSDGMIRGPWLVYALVL